MSEELNKLKGLLDEMAEKAPSRYLCGRLSKASPRSSAVMHYVMDISTDTHVYNWEYTFHEHRAAELSEFQKDYFLRCMHHENDNDFFVEEL